jgi:hypothetical protein
LSVDPRVPLTEQQIEKMYERLQAYKAGANNAGQTLIQQGMTAQRLDGGMELDYTQGRDQNRKNVFGIQGVAPMVAGFIDGQGGYSAAAVTVKTTTEMTVQPLLSLIAQCFTHRWNNTFGDDFAVEYNAKNYDDPTLDLQKEDKAAAAFERGTITLNEYRAAQGKPPIDGGDKYMPTAQPLVDQPGNPNPQPQPGMGAPGGDPMAAMLGGAAPDGDSEPQKEEDPLAEFDAAEFDTADELGDDEESGVKNPLLQEASGNRMAKAFQLNGKH